ncbi:MAG: hypothetical protein ABI353_15075 [Isosphaeraceae bacterium]
MDPRPWNVTSSLFPGPIVEPNPSPKARPSTPFRAAVTHIIFADPNNRRIAVGAWGVKSYEVDEAADALDAGFDRVHGATYEELTDDRSPLTLEQIQQRLASAETLAAAVSALIEEFGDDFDTWDEVARLAFAGVVVRHAELGVLADASWRVLAIDWLEHEDIDWDEATARRLRRQKEVALLNRAP